MARASLCISNLESSGIEYARILSMKLRKRVSKVRLWVGVKAKLSVDSPLVKVAKEGVSISK